MFEEVEKDFAEEVECSETGFLFFFFVNFACNKWKFRLCMSDDSSRRPEGLGRNCIEPTSGAHPEEV